MAESPAHPISSDSADWRALRLWIDVRIRKLQRDLESTVPLAEEVHNVTRGRIAELRDFRKAVEPERLLEASDLEEQDNYQGD